MTGTEDSPQFRLAYVPGVTPGKWARKWSERLPDVPLHLLQLTVTQAHEALRDGGADAGLVRLPVDRTVFSAIPLYEETTVVVVPKDHVIAAVDEVTLADLDDETVLHPLDDVFPWERPPGEPAFERPATTRDAVELVAAGIGVLVVPQSLARLHHRRDLTYRPVTDGPVSSVALSWREDATTDLVEEFIGIVRGRTPNSTRGLAGARNREKAQEAKGKDKAKAKTGQAQDGRPAGQGKPAKGEQRKAGGRPGAGAGTGRRRSPAPGKGRSTRHGKPRRRS